jgi:DNA invertase Pin-like site-specific DNA recombinase
MTPDKIAAAKKLLAAGSSPREVADAIGISIPTFYRHLPAGRSAGPAE